MAPNLRTASIKAPATASTSRTLADHLGDTLNVKSFGALGDGSNNDTSAIQACFDAAFITSGTAHGVTNAHLNRAVFFPAGKYITDAPLTLTDVYGARIYGSGRWTTLIQNGNTSNPNGLVTDGLSHCLLSDMQISSATTAAGIALDLNWGGSGSVGLSHNLFENMEFGFVSSGIRIANSNNEGHGNQFLHCSVGTQSGTGGPGWLIEGADALANHIIGGNTDNTMDYAVKCTGGSFHLQSLSTQTTDIADYYISSGNPCSIMGCRTESRIAFLVGLNGSAFVSGVSHFGSSANAIWANNTAYVIGNKLLDTTTYVVYTCTVNHTSAVAGTFAADRAGAASGKWSAQPISKLADLTNFKLIMDATASGDINSLAMGGVLVGDAASTFYSRGGIFLRDGAPANDFYTSFTGTTGAGTGSPWYVI